MAKNIDATRDALEELRARFTAAGSPGGKFRPHSRPARGRGDGEGWYELVSVDEYGEVLRGVKAVRYRPLVTDAVAV